MTPELVDPAGGGPADRTIRNRFANLIITADLSSLSLSQFTQLCELYDGLVTEHVVEAKDSLLVVLGGAIEELDHHADETKDMIFPGDTRWSRKNALEEFAVNRAWLFKLFRLVEDLDQQACTALLTRIEQVYREENVDRHATCMAVFKRMQERNRL